MLRGKFKSKGDEVRGERRKLHNEEITDLLTSPNVLEGRNQEE